jgi:hypothetical protein
MRRGHMTAQKTAHSFTTFANAFDCYEAIGRWLTEAAPEPWEQIAVDFTILEIDDVSETVITYAPSRGLFRRLRQFFIDDTRFADCFFALARLTSAPGKGYFKTCHYVLSKNGKYKANFDY